MNTVTALLPMKAHSERVPGKNTRTIAGRPLYHWVLSTLLDSPRVDRVVINTDSDAIKHEMTVFHERVSIHNRPYEIRGDFVSMNRIIAHDIDLLGEGHYLQTHATNPLLTTATVDRAVDQYFQELPEHDSLFGVTRLQTRLYNAGGAPVNHNPSELLRTQDLAPLYEENSTLYIFSDQSFRQAGDNRMGRKAGMFRVDKIEAVDIDEEADWLLAEALLELRKGGEIS